MNDLNLGVISVGLFTVEAIAEIVFNLYRDKSFNVRQLIVILVGVVIALVIPTFDIYAAVGISVVPPWVGRVLTGILAARGGNLVHDFLRIVEAAKANLVNNVAKFEASTGADSGASPDGVK